ncbi:MAG: nucleoside-diphosphate kinase [Planctomycetota bacterium]
MATQTTLILLKPDAVQRGLMGEVIGRIERKGLTFAAMKLIHVPEDLAKQHYAEHAERPFFPGLIKFVTSSPILACAVRGPSAIEVCRKLIGATNGQKAEPGTIRGDLGMSAGNNLIHGSDSAESAERELALWFPAGEGLIDYARASDAWVYDPQDLA